MRMSAHFWNSSKSVTKVLVLTTSAQVEAARDPRNASEIASFCVAVLKVRIHFPPAVSPQTIGSATISQARRRLRAAEDKGQPQRRGVLRGQPLHQSMTSSARTCHH